MTPEERDRLRTVEVLLAEMRDDLKATQADMKATRADMADLKKAQIRAGGIIVGASFVAAAFGWLIAKGATFAQKIGIGGGT